MREKVVLDLVSKRSIVKLRSTPRLSLEATFNGKSFLPFWFNQLSFLAFQKALFRPYHISLLPVSSYGMRTETILSHSLLNAPMFSWLEQSSWLISMYEWMISIGTQKLTVTFEDHLIKFLSRWSSKVRIEEWEGAKRRRLTLCTGCEDNRSSCCVRKGKKVGVMGDDLG